MHQDWGCHIVLRSAYRQHRDRTCLRWVWKTFGCFAFTLLFVMLLERPVAWAVDPIPNAPSTPVAVPSAREAPVRASDLAVSSAAPGYCASAGGSTEYEHITSASLTDNGDGTMKLQVNVFIANPQGCVSGEACPSYDPSPEYVNAWIDWNGDKTWDAAEQVMDKALTGYLAINYAGTMTGIAQFAIPAVVTETTWLRANLGWSHDPNNACEASWTWGNVVDQPVALKVPKIKEIKVTGSKDPKNPMTTYDVKTEAVLETPPGFTVTKVSWSGDLKPGDGNPYTYKPDKETHGKKKIKATVTYRNNASGTTGQVSKEFEFKLFFEKKGDDDGNGKPNWFDYWGKDGAVAGLTAADVDYNAAGTGYGAWENSSDKLTLEPLAAEVHYSPALNVPASAKCPGGNFGGAKGIDSVAEVIAHERQHEAFWDNWNKNGTWVISTTVDTDDPTPNDKSDIKGDMQPDDYENNTSKTDPTKLDSCNLEVLKSAVYKWYGDEEFSAVQAGDGKKGVADKDWANPGKQSDPSFITAAVTLQSTVSSGAVTVVSAYQTPQVVIPDLAQVTGSYTDAGVDENSDGLFEHLRITVGVNVTTPARYDLVGWLQSPSGVDLAWASASAELGAGAQTVQLAFDGKVLRAHNENGPYKLAHLEIRIGDHSDVVDFVDNAYTTAAYAVTSFAPSAVTYTGAYTDSGADTNSNGLFDTLAINVGVTVNQAGNYTLVGWLYDSDGKPISGAVATTAFTTSGAQPLNFDGKSIRWHRKNGPYALRYLEVRDANQERVVFLAQAYNTTAYAVTQFETGGAAVIDAAAYTDQGVDLNSDGLYDFLRVSTAVTNTTAGAYALSAKLLDANGQSIVDVSREFSLTIGSHSVTLDFPGGAIRQHGVDGPYQVAQVALATSDGTVVDQQALAAATQPYTATAFALPLVALASDFRDEAVDVDSDNQKDYLNISLNILPGNNGVVIAQGRLVDKNGAEIQWVETNVAVTAGTMQTITLPFSATQILTHGVDGPYLLQNVLIYHTGDPSQAIDNLEPYVTASYDHTTLAILVGPPAIIELTATPNQLLADGSSTSQIVVTVKDANGQLVPNSAVNLATSLGEISPASDNTDINGRVTATLKAATVRGIATVTASTGNVNNTVTVSLIAGAPAGLTIIASPTTLTADGQSVATIRVTVSDAFGNPVAGQVVNFTTSLGNIVSSAQTDGNGVATAPLTATTSGVAQVTASLGALQSTALVTFTSAEQKLYLPLIER